MKKTSLLIGVLSLSVFGSVNAANVSVKMTGPTHNNRYFLCLYDVGCMSMEKAAQQNKFSISSGTMKNLLKIAVTDTKTMQVYTQPISHSCQVEVDKNQTVNITGSLSVDGDTVRINQLECHTTSQG